MRTIKTDAELLAATLAQVRVTVRGKDGKIADYGGAVERYSPKYVRIAGAYYLRSIYEFTTGVRR